MKLAPLLAQYFYSHKRLDIPGIGSFLLSQELFPSTEPGKSPLAEGITFENNSAVRESADLVNYISQESGKLKALAAADLDSHVEQAKQFLHIGKPFLFEGIGSLTKQRDGQYTFSPGAILAEKLAETKPRDLVEEVKEERMPDYKSILYLKKIKHNWRKPLTIGLVMAGLALAIWGGYMINKSMQHKSEAVEVAAIPQSLVLADSDTVRSTETAVITQPNPGYYKFVVETAERTRALKRYGFLKSNGLAIQMETNDSIMFRLYFQLPALAADTIKIRDSLKSFYTPAGKEAYVE